MARSVNKITLVGRCGSDPEARQLRNGMKKVEVSVATNRTRRGEEHTDWFSCQFWDKLADLAEQLLSKGTLVYIEGRMESSTYQDKNGNNRTRWEVSVSTFVPMDPERRDGSGGYGGGKGNPSKSYGQSSGYGGDRGGGYNQNQSPSKGGGNDWLDDDSNIPF